MVRMFALGAVLLAGLTVAWAGEVKSGPQVGAAPLPFHPLNILNADNSAANGTENCLVCQYGSKPVALVFARCCDCAATAELAKKLDAEVAKVGKSKMAAAIVFLSDDGEMKEKLREFVKKNELSNISVAVMPAKGPSGYSLSDKAGTTVILYKNRKVVANHAFESLCNDCVSKVVADLKLLEVK